MRDTYQEFTYGCPPPVAVLIALKQLAQARSKRPYDSTHVILIPRLLYHEEWQTRFEKEADVWFVMHTSDYWPHFPHKPLNVDIAFPLYRHYPWQLRLESLKVVEIGRSLSSLSKTSHIQVGDYLRKLWCNLRLLPAV